MELNRIESEKYKAGAPRYWICEKWAKPGGNPQAFGETTKPFFSLAQVEDFIGKKIVEYFNNSKCPPLPENGNPVEGVDYVVTTSDMVFYENDNSWPSPFYCLNQERWFGEEHLGYYTYDEMQEDLLRTCKEETEKNGHSEKWTFPKDGLKLNRDYTIKETARWIEEFDHLNKDDIAARYYPPNDEKPDPTEREIRQRRLATLD